MPDNSNNKIYDLYVTPTFVHNRMATREWGYEYRTIDFHNLLYIYGGRGIFGTDGVKSEVSAGDLVYFKKGCSQYMETDKTNLLRLYTVNFLAVLPEYSTNNTWSLTEPKLDLNFITHITDTSVQNRFEILFSRLCSLFLTNSGMHKAKARQSLTELIELADLCCQNRPINYGARSRINRTVDYMTKHYSEKLTLNMLADAAGLSCSHFSAVFREVMGKSPIDYLISLRISKAKQLLCDGFSVTRTAEAVGFPDIYYFSNMFKKIEGISPKCFTAKHKEQC